MKKYSALILIFVLFISLFLSGCQNPMTLLSETSSDGTSSNDEISEKNEEIEMTEEEREALEIKLFEEKLKERQELEEKRKEELGEFYVPLINISEEREREIVEAKGLYVTGNVASYPVEREDVALYGEYIKALVEKDFEKINSFKVKKGTVNKFEKIIATAVATEINSFVIDVKDDDGLMTYKSNVKIVDEVEGNRSIRMEDVKALIDLLNEYNIYPIARIVTFKDRNFSKHKPKHSIQLKSGGIWKDNKGVSWVNPFDKYVWDYNVAIAKEAALLGFKEIQFDYVRFPANASSYNKVTEFPERNGRDKDKAIEGFLEYAKKELELYNVNIAADVFGVITRSWDDKPEDIGQTWRKIARNVDYMSPMIYPSHYGPRWYGYDVPDAHPYGVLSGALKESIERNAAIDNRPIIRPWIQGFTATWVTGYIKYGTNEIRDQIIAGKELGINEYIVWNPKNNYDPLAYIPSDEENTLESSKADSDGKEDSLGRTPDLALKEYLKAEKRNVYSKIFLLTPISSRNNSFDLFKKELEKVNMKLIKFEVKDYILIDKSNAKVNLSYKYAVKGKSETQIEREDTWKLTKENGIWKVIKPRIVIEENSTEDIVNE